MAFTGLLQQQKITIIMDGRIAWWDNVFVEPLWGCLTYEDACLRVDDNLTDAGASLGRYLDTYNAHQLHWCLGVQTSEQAYSDHLRPWVAAAKHAR